MDATELRYFDRRFKRLETLMGQLADRLNQVEASLDAALSRTQEDVAKLQADIAALQEKIDQGLATPEDLETLDRIQTKLDALDPVKPDTLPEPEPEV